MECSIVIVGDEILAGHVRDANAPFLIERITARGHAVHRVSIVPDDRAVIASETRAQLQAGDLVIVCGGLGPTHDDVTAEGVADALGRPLVACAAFAEQIEAAVIRVEREGFSSTSFGADGFRKMALVPEGSTWLQHEARVMPAFAVDSHGTTVLLLPGPPEELAAVFTHVVEPIYLMDGKPKHVRELSHPYPEATLAGLLADLALATPVVSIGSYPRADDSLIRVSGPADEVDRIAAVVASFLADLDNSDEGKRLSAFMARRRASDPRSG